MRYQRSHHRYYMIGQQLKSARHKINIHPSVIANILGHKDPGIVFNIEDGDTRVPLESLPQLAKAREIVDRAMEPCPEDKVSVAIVLSAIEQKTKIM